MIFLGSRMLNLLGADAGVLTILGSSKPKNSLAFAKRVAAQRGLACQRNR